VLFFFQYCERQFIVVLFLGNLVCSCPFPPLSYVQGARFMLKRFLPMTILSASVVILIYSPWSVTLTLCVINYVYKVCIAL